MKFVVEVEMGNAEMETYEHLSELMEHVARTLRTLNEISSKPRATDRGYLRDINGNTIGWYAMKG